MKQLITIFLFFIVFVSCKENKKSADKAPVVLLPDTFQMHNNSVLTDKNGTPVPYVVVKPKANENPKKTTTTSSNTANSSTSVPTNTSTTTTTTTVPAKKKGWSNSAKGAVIGGSSGAVAGAIIAGDGNRVGGAVIGSVVGAAGGYIIGKSKDKKQAKKENN